MVHRERVPPPFWEAHSSWSAGEVPLLCAVLLIVELWKPLPVSELSDAVEIPSPRLHPSISSRTSRSYRDSRG